MTTSGEEMDDQRRRLGLQLLHFANHPVAAKVPPHEEEPPSERQAYGGDASRSLEARLVAGIGEEEWRRQ